MWNRLIAWLANVGRWLVAGLYVWLWAAGLGLVFLLCRWLAVDWELRLRLAGMSLEVLGLGTVVFGLMRTRSDFRKTTLLADLWSWLQQFPRFSSRHISISGTASLSLGGSASLAVGRITSPNATLEQRVASLERDVQRLDAVDLELSRSLERVAAEHKGGLEQSAQPASHKTSRPARCLRVRCRAIYT
jgi:hypothetical protein